MKIPKAPLAALLIVLAAAALTGCAGLRPGYETPTVTISSFKAIPSEGGLPAFEIGLRVINPNIEPLELRGVSYTISIEGHDIIKGVGNDLPVIDGYGEGEFKLTASANLFAGIRLITDLMRSDRNTFKYEFEAKLDVGAFMPSIRVTDANEISLRPTAGIRSEYSQSM
ncbi:MAG: LEA type 2 family protein [Gammaproteobacteria bacterium]|nr:LEA type 2 family protein [Gammaproteobacteria bacterium]